MCRCVVVGVVWRCGVLLLCCKQRQTTTDAKNEKERQIQTKQHNEIYIDASETQTNPQPPQTQRNTTPQQKESY